MAGAGPRAHPRRRRGAAPGGILWLGLLATLATPLLRVTAAVIGFLGGGERRMAGLGAAVLIVITLAVVIAQQTAA